MNFADTLVKRIDTVGAPLCIGFDPRPDWIPHCFFEVARAQSKNDEEFVYSALLAYLRSTLTAVAPYAAALKPNLAFFERLGLGGLRAFAQIVKESRELGVPVIADAKRGDIGSTAEAYADAFFTRTSFERCSVTLAEVDALTVNPFLGFDTLEPLLRSCEENGRGMFVLVKTSNPGSADLQDLQAEGSSISERVAEWLSTNSERLIGSSGLSGLGAVVGATYPAEAKALRERMPNNLFLIPGLGAQGGDAEAATAGFTKERSGAIVNVSRGILGQPSSLALSETDFSEEVAAKALQQHRELQAALQ